MSELRKSLKKWLGSWAGTQSGLPSGHLPAATSSIQRHIGSDKFLIPHGTDWFWRPEMWRSALSEPRPKSVQNGAKLGSEVKLFHDCRLAEISLGQVPSGEIADAAPYGLSLEVSGFDGSFLSLVLDLPEEALQGLQKRHLIRLDAMIDLEKPLPLFARLNIKHGPNVVQVIRELTLKPTEMTVEFDLGYSDLNEKRLERAWIDLIFKEPQNNNVMMRDMILCRFPRAEV
ncbi:DUF6478 family protein [Roseovarius sp. EL26]|uniref:DUF6478 family protein n=1 Tax=Roseovarius sp. EL26 TaxID=2126672 RepID=UPI0020B12DF0|nr:DUF6478 family protein [Roseovarius sp. EL26]